MFVQMLARTFLRSHRRIPGRIGFEPCASFGSSKLHLNITNWMIAKQFEGFGGVFPVCKADVSGSWTAKGTKPTGFQVG